MNELFDFILSPQGAATIFFSIVIVRMSTQYGYHLDDVMAHRVPALSPAQHAVYLSELVLEAAPGGIGIVLSILVATYITRIGYNSVISEINTANNMTNVSSPEIRAMEAASSNKIIIAKEAPLLPRPKITNGDFGGPKPLAITNNSEVISLESVVIEISHLPKTGVTSQAI